MDNLAPRKSSQGGATWAQNVCAIFGFQMNPKCKILGKNILVVEDYMEKKTFPLDLPNMN